MGNDRLIYIRTDGNSRIASGHLVRCVSIAFACRSLGMDVCFLVSDKESLCLLEELLISGDMKNELPDTCQTPGQNTSSFPDGITALQLQTAEYDNLEKELPEVISLLASTWQYSAFEHGRKCIKVIEPNIYDTSVISQKKYKHVVYFTDSYFVTEKYLSALFPFAKTAYIDDLRAFDYPVRLIINYDVIPSGDMPSYRAAYTNAERLLLGASYTPLRSQFLHKQAAVKEQITDILITTGGSDPFHFCLNFINYLNSSHDKETNAALSVACFHIVIGKLNSDREKIRQAASGSPFLKLHENVNDMASLMGQCDMAVSASGTTLYELCALGVPTISFTMADNQLTAAKAFDNVNAIPCAGDIRTSMETVLQAVFHFIRNNTFENRKAAHHAMHSLIDGRGALRIASALKEL